MVDITDANGLNNLLNDVLTKDASPLYEDLARQYGKPLSPAWLRIIDRANQRALRGDDAYEKPSEREMPEAIQKAVTVKARLEAVEAQSDAVAAPSRAPNPQGGAIDDSVYRPY